MIATCPRCSARYRIAKEKLRPEGVRMRCARCEAVFRVRPPAPASPPAAVASPSLPRAEAPPTQPPGEAVPERPRPVPERPREAVDRERLALVAIPDADLAKETASALSARGLHTSVVHDGVEAMLEIQRQLPRQYSLLDSFGIHYAVCDLLILYDNLIPLFFHKLLLLGDFIPLSLNLNLLVLNLPGSILNPSFQDPLLPDQLTFPVLNNCIDQQQAHKHLKGDEPDSFPEWWFDGKTKTGGYFYTHSVQVVSFHFKNIFPCRKFPVGN